MRTATKKKKKTNDLKIGASFDLMGPDIDSPSEDRDMEKYVREFGRTPNLKRIFDRNLPRERARYKHLKGV